MSLPVINRTCGECTFCCELLEVEDKDSGFKKEGATKCEHLTNTGCGIYESKPKVCTGFYCMFLVNHRPGMFRDTDRPDKIGILAVMNNPDSEFTRFARMPSFTLYETRPNAFHEYHAGKLMKRISKHWLCILMPWSARENKYKLGPGTKFIGPPKALTMVERFNTLEENIHGEDR